MTVPVPLAADVRALVGDFAEEVENRSLLLDKMAIPKTGVDSRIRANEASRWSLLRLSDAGRAELRREIAQKQRDARTKRNHDVREEAAFAADALERLSRSRCESPDAQELRQAHSRRLLQLLKSSAGPFGLTMCACLRSRLAINLSEGLIENAGIALDRLFGLPYIPGSALKGCARHAAMRCISELPVSARPEAVHDFALIFGTAEADFGPGKDLEHLVALLPSEQRPPKMDRRGGVTFLPSYPLTEAALEVDLTNVHTPGYYAGKGAGELRELARESPRPIPFPVVAAGTGFAFALFLNPLGQRSTAPERLLARAREWLVQALTIDGVGAKTGAGYGWFTLSSELDEETRKAAHRDKEAAEAAAAEEARKRAAAAQEAEAKAREQARLASLSPAERFSEAALRLDDQEFAAALLLLDDKDEEERLGLVQAGLHPSKRDRLKKWRKSKKPNDRQRIELLTKYALQFGLKMP